MAEIIVLVVLVLFIVGVVILSAAVLLIAVIVGFLAFIAFAASAGGKKSGKTKDYLHFQSKAVKERNLPLPRGPALQRAWGFPLRSRRRR